MSKTSKALLIGGIILVVGLVIGLIGFALSGFNFEGLSSAKAVTNTYDVTESFQNISIDVKTDEIFIQPSEDGKCHVVCEESDKFYHQVKVTNNTLMITTVDDTSWTDWISRSSEVWVYLPEKAYQALDIHSSTGKAIIQSNTFFDNITVEASTGDVFVSSSSKKTDIKVTTGDINLSDLSSDEISLETSTGRIQLNSVTCSGKISTTVSTGKTVLNDVSCKSFISNGTTGDVDLTNVIAEESFSIERSTGDVTLDGCDAPDIYVKTSTGEVKASLLSPKIFFTDSNTGDIDVPKTTTGGTCTIETDTGDIEITIKK